MPTLNDLYGDVYDIPAEDLPDAYLDGEPIYPDKIEKKEKVLAVPQRVEKNVLQARQPAKTGKSSTNFEITRAQGKGSGGEIKI